MPIFFKELQYKEFPLFSNLQTLGLDRLENRKVNLASQWKILFNKLLNGNFSMAADQSQAGIAFASEKEFSHYTMYLSPYHIIR